jgi:hypothetical protein
MLETKRLYRELYEVVDINYLPRTRVNLETRLLLNYLKPYYDALVIGVIDTWVPRTRTYPINLKYSIIVEPSGKSDLLNESPAIWYVCETLGYAKGARNTCQQQLRLDHGLTKGAYKLENGIWKTRLKIID